MHQLYSKLSFSQYDWTLDFTTKKTSQELICEVESLTGDSVEERELYEYCKTKITEHLSREECSQSEFNLISNHIHLEYLCDGANEHQSNLINAIRYFININGGCSSRLDDWVLSHKLIQILLYSNDNIKESHSFMNYGKRMLAEAALRLRDRGIQCAIVDGAIQISAHQYSFLLQMIDCRAKRLGDKLYKYILSKIKSCYCSRHDRFYFRKEIDMFGSNISPEIPIGYIYNLALKNLYVKKNSNAGKDIQEIVELSTDLMTVSDLQWFNPWDSLFQSVELIPYLQKNLLHDELFTIHQSNNSIDRLIINGLFNKYSNAKIPSCVNLNIYIDIFDVVHMRSDIDVQIIDLRHLYGRLSRKYTLDEIKIAVSRLSIDSSELNSSYIDPFQVGYINYNKKPFLKCNDEVRYINTYFHSVGFVNFLKEEMKSQCHLNGVYNREFNKVRGDIAEECVRNILKSKGINFHAGVKYKVPANVLNEIESRSLSGECDFIIETNDYIVFIEHKVKELNVESKGGDVLSGLVDLTHSLFASQEQACKHEYLLRKQGEIKFDNGYILELKGRRVEKVSLSLFDYYSLADNISIRGIFNSILNSTLSTISTDQEINKNIANINKVIERLQKIYLSDIFQAQYINELHLNTQGIRFYSLNQLISILKHSSGNEQFICMMNRTKSIVSNSHDWFRVFNYHAIDLYNSVEN